MGARSGMAAAGAAQAAGDLRVRVRKALPHFQLDVDLCCPAGRVLVVTGPSGSGKTTLLRLIAGLDTPDEGRVSLGGEVWLDTAAGQRRRPQQRGVGLVFQEYSLFPHMTLAGNVAYATSDSAWALELLESFGIAHLAAARPGEMSGGERQRGALCQALARRPRALLLDEPFSALDTTTRASLREELLRVRERFHIPIIHVTHDLAEAALLADEVCSINRGVVDPHWFERRAAERMDEERVLRERLARAPSQAVAPARIGAARRPAAQTPHLQPFHPPQGDVA